ncbi:hypothetical protein RvY_14316 [Ramazzottius varieornatus]|uniref:DDE-1 domain-containing protein n=1 Tax=Ramazzottius varieornatus TaxID=947166 RepID=A0A1D1VQX2_RAMVA|nr:hypothetical protein RvY_14316 [Ramazzottius varieornatus]
MHQSGFGYEKRPGRTPDFVGAKHVLALTQSQSSMTHSYTVMMCVPPGVRKFLPVLFITLQEPNEIFGRLVKKSMFKASNLYVTASTSGKITMELYSFFPHTNQRCIFLADSLSTFSDQETVEGVKPEELEHEMITIPPKVAGQIQPLDVLCFPMFTGCFRKVTNWIFLNNQPAQVHHRYVILKMHSLIY